MSSNRRNSRRSNRDEVPPPPPPPPPPAVVVPLIGPEVLGLLAQLLQNQQQQQNVIQDQQQAQAQALTQVIQHMNDQRAEGRVHHRLGWFEGKASEDVDDWIRLVEAEAAAGDWNEALKMKMAKAALRGSASRWMPPDDANNNWMACTAIKLAFRKKYTYNEWIELVAARKQLVGESAAQYVSEMKKLLQFSPKLLDEEEYVKMIIQGIRHVEFAPSLLTNPPTTLNGFAVAYGLMETNAAYAPKTTIQNVQPSSSKIEEMQAEIDKLRREAKDKPSSSRYSPYPSRDDRDRRVDRRLYDDERYSETRKSSFNDPPLKSKCYNCNDDGHIQRDCPFGEKVCFNCKKSKHFARDCTAPKATCHRCGSSVHIFANCPNRGSTRFDRRAIMPGNETAGPKGAGSAVLP